MPGKRKPKAAESKAEVQHGIYFLPSDAAWGGFINVRLDDEQASSFREWFAENVGDVSRLWEDLLSEEAKTTVVWDAEHSCIIVSVAGALVAGSNERYVSTSRAASLLEALGLTVWKHFYLCDGDYGNYKPNGGYMSWG